MVGILFKQGCYEYVANMDLEDSFFIIEEILKEYNDSRTYNHYLFDNLLLRFDGKGIDYLTYIGRSKILKSNTKTDYNKAKNENSKILNKFVKQGGIVS